MRKHDYQAEGLNLDGDRYRFLVEQSADIISTHRPGDWAFTAVNPAVTALFGYQPEELIGKPAYDYFHPEDAEAMKQRLIPSIYRHGIRTFRYRHRHQNGRYLWVESTQRSIRDQDSGELREIISVTRDITPQLEAEQQAQQHQAEVAHVARLMTMGEMASGIAHEINQPLATILNYSRGAIRQIDSGKLCDAEQLLPVLDNIARQTERTADIVRRLRALVRKTPYQRRAVAINSVCRDVLALLRHELQEQKVAVDCHLTTAEPTIRADPVQLEQVLLNLLRNALDAYRGVRGERKNIQLKTAVSGQQLLIGVTDYGAGIAADLLPRLFEPYVSSKEEGLGMGLSISRSIVEAHGGAIEINTDNGTCFVIKLPLGKTP